ncbi:choline TMA-lyase-activating enzyme [Bacillus sp. FJAT-29814]|uniref:choline TMA-lyase-activating enzyme n=1 Tax=Bacillus sp. FJAT-29814 TaxID=1729688 RepID=UPI000834C531|nr:choline TMA-lyase-activating enzyme [Bacillus sp. FJAT-29814]
MTGLIERKAFIFNVQKYNMFDGPGVRTIVFFKGCPLRCKWCANPEGLDRKYQVMLKQSVCTDCGACVPVCPVGMLDLSKGKLEVSRDIDCTGCRKCIDVCPESALSIAGEAKTISELLEIVEEDRMFYEMSGGGITLGGGEVLMQPEAAVNLLMACKKEGINTAIETSGYAKLDSVLQVAEFTDLFLYDIKHMDSERHFELTGVRNERILNNLSELLKRRYNVQIRMPLLKGYNDGKEEIDQVIQFLLPYKDYKNFKGIDLLPYHKFGVNKYAQLGKEYQTAGNPIMTETDMNRIESWFKQYDFPVKIVNH